MYPVPGTKGRPPLLGLREAQWGDEAAVHPATQGWFPNLTPLMEFEGGAGEDAMREAA